MIDRSVSVGDDIAWAERCEYWADEPTEPKHRGRRPRHINRPLVITGHGMSLNVHQGTLLIKSGFTHYPQEREERRFFPGDRELPSRIIVVHGTGSITFDVLAWLSSHGKRCRFNGKVSADAQFQKIGIKLALEHLQTGKSVSIDTHHIR